MHIGDLRGFFKSEVNDVELTIPRPRRVGMGKIKITGGWGMRLSRCVCVCVCAVVCACASHVYLSGLSLFTVP